MGTTAPERGKGAEEWEHGTSEADQGTGNKGNGRWKGNMGRGWAIGDVDSRTGITARDRGGL